MPESLHFALLLAASYLVGSIPFGLLVARMRGVDIRKVGSGNIGATNVLRSVGKPWGILVFVLDFLKGFGPALAGVLLFPETNHGLYAGLAAIAGHNWPVWLGFKGGKGVATSAGMLAAVAWKVIVVGLLVWIVTLKASRFVSLASILAAVAAAAAAWTFHPDNPVLAGLISLLAILILGRHRQNIRRLLRGEEHRFGRKQETAKPRENA